MRGVGCARPVGCRAEGAGGRDPVARRDPATRLGVAARARRVVHDERGAGAVLVVGVCGALVVLTLVLVPLLGGFAAQARARSAADAGALAAADALSGRVSGDPCERAAEVIVTAGATMRSCTLDGATARVETSVDLGWAVVVAHARAGPALGTRRRAEPARRRHRSSTTSRSGASPAGAPIMGPRESGGTVRSPPCTRGAHPYNGADGQPPTQAARSTGRATPSRGPLNSPAREETHPCQAPTNWSSSSRPPRSRASRSTSVTTTPSWPRSGTFATSSSPRTSRRT
nr:Rv3654c family TadE-like protein [Pseudoclavibacter chungangensis]